MRLSLILRFAKPGQSMRQRFALKLMLPHCSAMSPLPHTSKTSSRARLDDGERQIAFGGCFCLLLFLPMLCIVIFHGRMSMCNRPSKDIGRVAGPQRVHVLALAVVTQKRRNHSKCFGYVVAKIKQFLSIGATISRLRWIGKWKRSGTLEVC